MSFLTAKKISEYVLKCIQLKIIDPDIDTSFILYDYDILKQKTEAIKQAFPQHSLHTAAIKANPVLKIIEKLYQNHFGAEVASEGELKLALKAGFKSKEIVFDSPVKTISELTFALQKDVHINADSLLEIDRITKIKESITSNSKIGLRINPQVGAGKIELTSVADEYSKFGVPINVYKTEIIESFIKHSWLNGLHLHIGSQGCHMDMLLNGISKVLDLIVEINKNIKNQNRQIEFLDIGGGLPVSYYHSIEPLDIKIYASQIKELTKKYNLESLKLITEFGRYLHANAGCIVSKVEYVKHYQSSNTLMVHSGADIMLRECLNPGSWYHEFTLLDKNGKLKTSDKTLQYTIAGPLCFAGDIVGRNIELPLADEGDYLVIHDTGGYTFSMWSKYVSRLFPKVIGIENSNFNILLNRETTNDILHFWSR